MSNEVSEQQRALVETAVDVASKASDTAAIEAEKRYNERVLECIPLQVCEEIVTRVVSEELKAGRQLNALTLPNLVEYAYSVGCAVRAAHLREGTKCSTT